MNYLPVTTNYNLHLLVRSHEMLCSVVYRLLIGLAFFTVVLGQATRTFKLSLTLGNWSPNGHQRQVILVNGQFPGPTLKMWQGENVVVEVENNITNATSIHFHGIEMHDTPWSDGAPGVSQRHIQPGKSFTYRWMATQHGSYWYHSHSRHQIEDGLFGALVIAPKPDTPKPFDKISTASRAIKTMESADESANILLLSDYRNMTGDEAWELTQKAELDPACWDSILINGKGRVHCPEPAEIDALLSDLQRTQLGKMNATMTSKGCYPPQLMALAWNGHGNGSVVPSHVFDECQSTEGWREILSVDHKSTCDDESWIAIHFIGAFQSITATVSVDEHPMWVYAADGGYVEPREVQAITITNGERYSVLIKANKAGKFNIRVASINDPQIIAGYATLDVKIAGSEGNGHESVPYINDAGMAISSGVVIFDQSFVKPFPPVAIPQTVSATHVLEMGNIEPAYIWTMNSMPLESLTLEQQTPFLLNPQLTTNLTIPTQNNTWVDLILVTHVSPNPAHPIHKHGVKMHLLGTGYGPWVWSSVEDAARQMPSSFNLVDPPLKDSFTSLRVGLEAGQEVAWMALRYHSRNPGAWLLHCHVLQHLVGGMQVVLLDGVDVWPEMPEEYRALAEGSG
ncbi:hypothetical protein jhhlp_006328 [Lomentospora prolificans]|uniref:Multicopper oxidase n=1 Tax=Lomentospora prolificans TaxID=41688 RepID=A0A2N3N5K3_9PEZI|nr:hypothetical protein jhhlp_006328 [Lomentospora prolificans]